MWMRIVQSVGACPLIMAGVVSVLPVSPGMASSQVLPASACSRSGRGVPPANWLMSVFGITNTGEGPLVDVACPIPTDPSTKNLKITVFYKAVSTVPPTWILSGQTANAPMSCTVVSQDRSSSDIVQQRKDFTISSGRAGTLVGNLVITVNQAHKINALYCTVPGPVPYLRPSITGYQVDHS